MGTEMRERGGYRPLSNMDKDILLEELEIFIHCPYSFQPSSSTGPTDYPISALAVQPRTDGHNHIEKVQ